MTQELEQGRLEALVADLRKIPVLADLAQADLEWLAAQCEEVHGQPGQVFVHENTPADRMIVLLEGEIRGRRETSGADSTVVSVQAPMVTGLLPFSRLKIYPLTIRAVVPVRALT